MKWIGLSRSLWSMILPILALVLNQAGVTGADEIQTAFGYTLTGITAAGGALAEDDTNDRAEYTCNTITWTAAGGSIGPSPGAFIYDDTDADKTVIGYLDFGSEQTATTGNTFSIANIAVRLA